MTEAHAMPNPNFVDEFRRRLWEQRRDLLRTLVLTDDELATLEAHQAGAVVEDAATETVGAIS
jgi:hypothetical protein